MSVKTSTTNTLKYRLFWIVPFITSLRIMSRLSAHTKDRSERLFFKIIMSLKEKFVRRLVLKKCLSSDSFLLPLFVP